MRDNIANSYRYLSTRLHCVIFIIMIGKRYLASFCFHALLYWVLEMWMRWVRTNYPFAIISNLFNSTKLRYRDLHLSIDWKKIDVSFWRLLQVLWYNIIIDGIDVHFETYINWNYKSSRMSITIYSSIPLNKIIIVFSGVFRQTTNS